MSCLLLGIIQKQDQRWSQGFWHQLSSHNLHWYVSLLFTSSITILSFEISVTEVVFCNNSCLFIWNFRMVLQGRYEGTQTHAILRFIFLFWVFMRDYFLHKFLVCHTDQSSTQLLSGFMRYFLLSSIYLLNHNYVWTIGQDYLVPVYWVCSSFSRAAGLFVWMSDYFR